MKLEGSLRAACSAERIFYRDKFRTFFQGKLPKEQVWGLDIARTSRWISRIACSLKVFFSNRGVNLRGGLGISLGVGGASGEPRLALQIHTGEFWEVQGDSIRSREDQFLPSDTQTWYLQKLRSVFLKIVLAGRLVLSERLSMPMFPACSGFGCVQVYVYCGLRRRHLLLPIIDCSCHFLSLSVYLSYSLHLFWCWYGCSCFCVTWCVVDDTISVWIYSATFKLVVLFCLFCLTMLLFCPSCCRPQYLAHSCRCLHDVSCDCCLIAWCWCLIYFFFCFCLVLLLLLLLLSLLYCCCCCCWSCSCWWGNTIGTKIVTGRIICLRQLIKIR